MIRAAALCVMTAVPGVAGAEGVDPAALVQAEILPGWQTAAGTRMAALHLILAPHWKTYWRAPGDAGIPPAIDLSGSGNIAGVALHWPVPEVFDLAGMQTIGYTDDLILPLEFTATDPAAPMQLAARIDLGVCRDICVPVSLVLSADLSGPGAASPRIAAALTAQPVAGAKAGLRAISCVIDPLDDGLRLTAVMELPPTGGVEVGVIEVADPSLWATPAELVREGGMVSITADLVPEKRGPVVLDRSGVRITILGSERAVDIQGCPAG